MQPRNSVDGFRNSVDGFRNSVDGFRLGGEGFRLVSSTPSCANQGSGQDDIESLGDVYIWGELWSDGGLPDGCDSLIPKPLESNVVLDVHQISCGVRHVALVTRQGEVFTWGEESGGRLGQGIEKNFSRPQLVEFLAVTNVDLVSCGEFHSCAVSTNGDLFSWGDGIHNAGLLGHGTDASHWIPKRVSGPMEGLQVVSIGCGSWHSALTIANGKLFTFGDGTFGALGHGDRESVRYPKEVVQLNGLRTMKVACGVWHTAAIVEVMNHSPSGISISSRKLFTWGDGDKYRLGHGNKSTYLLPTCVSNLIDYNFLQIACGNNLTVSLTTSGHIFTMGSTTHGQLGNPQADGKAPCLVQDKLVGEFVEEIACGAYHVAVLTSRNEVYTWGKGTNGRLGHGDIEDRKIPTYVEALKDRLVKSISCGSNFTAAICIHKWVSGADQLVCSGCRQAFGFTRKRHNCYNCGLVHCGACSSKKSVRAALAPIQSKPHRVCDGCYNKLKGTTAPTSSLYCKRPASSRRSIDAKDRFDKPETKSSRILLSPTTEPVKYLEVRNQIFGRKSESVSMVRASQVPSFQLLKDIAFPSSLTTPQIAPKPFTPSPSPMPSTSRPASPYGRRPSPACSASMVSRGVLDSLKKSNELLGREVSRLQKHLTAVKEKCELLDEENQKLHKNAREASLVAAQQSAKCRAAEKVVKSFTSQIEEVAEKAPPEVCENLKAVQTQALAFIEASDSEASESQTSLASALESANQVLQNESNAVKEDTSSTKGHKIITLDSSLMGDISHSGGTSLSSATETTDNLGLQEGSSKILGGESETAEESKPPSCDSDAVSNENVATSSQASTSSSEGEGIEQFDRGVYITFIQRRDGTKVFRYIRFSKRRFNSTQAEEWWRENKDRMYLKYPPPRHNRETASTSSATTTQVLNSDIASTSSATTPQVLNSETASSSSSTTPPPADPPPE